MTLFKYRAVDEDGLAIEGTLEEESARRVVVTLQERNLTVNAVERAGPAPEPSPTKTKLSWEDLELLNDQLFTITRSGTPLAPSLAAMGHELRNRRIRELLEDVRRRIEGGDTLEAALSAHTGDFPPVYAALVAAGERAGNLSAVFECLSRYSRRMVELKSSLFEVLAYPLIVIVAATAIVIGMLWVIVPQFAAVFMDFGGELPAPTMFLLHVSDALRTYPGVLVAVAAAFAGLCAVTLPSLLRTESGGYRRDRLKLLLPFAGRIYASVSVARFCRALGLLLQSHVPMVESVNLAAAAAGNAVLNRAVKAAAQRVSSGMPLSEALKQTGYFDSGFCWLLGNAEQRGDMPDALFVLEDDHERAVDRMRRWMMTVAGPVAVVVVGLVIGFVSISLYLPIFTLGDQITG